MTSGCYVPPAHDNHQDLKVVTQSMHVVIPVLLNSSQIPSISSLSFSPCKSNTFKLIRATVETLSLMVLQIEMAHKVLSSDMAELINSMKLAQQYSSTYLEADYRKGMLKAAHVLAMDSKNLLDAVDNARKIQMAVHEQQQQQEQGAASCSAENSTDNEGGNDDLLQPEECDVTSQPVDAADLKEAETEGVKTMQDQSLIKGGVDSTEMSVNQQVSDNSMSDPDS